MFPLLKYTAEEVDEYYAKVTPEMVRASLAKDRHDWFDLLNLVSPAAYPFMDEMRRKARLARIKYYGKTVSVYAPLYIVRQPLPVLQLPPRAHGHRET